MKSHYVRVWDAAESHPREDELAWKIAEYALSRPPIDDDVEEMVRCRVVDNAAVALAAINRQPAASARAMALAAEAGRLSHLSGAMPKRAQASASSPQQGRIT